MIEPWKIDIYSRTVKILPQAENFKETMLVLADAFDKTIDMLKKNNSILGAYFGLRTPSPDGSENISFKVQVKNANRI